LPEGTYGRVREEYYRDLSKNSKKDQNAERRVRINDCGGGIQDNKNSRCNAGREGNIGEGILVPPGTGFGERTLRYFRINFSFNHKGYGWVAAAYAPCFGIVKLLLFVV